MKNLLMKTAATLVFGAFLMGAATASAAKIAFVDVQAVASQLPQAQQVQETIMAEFGERIEAVGQLERDINFNVEKIRRDGPTMSESQQQELAQQIQQQQRQYEELARPLDEQMRQRQAEERNKIMALIKNAIDQVAASGDYDIVLNSGAAVYAKDSYDISDVVVRQLTRGN
ncbi:OmpH family outer membrane protein [Alkalimonas collagenimarina]|uniref:OmpH family outer membrane protein n=1 Tax=Alkalimonas collagenimarina TaxID=400390 RepID=A0ABT9GV57_9GAMM|nr:OmpH family outer membrane protein [Alkalimonas collagenimarina]MDP4534930.1 OmpH family outer membrane protein [Alkalimonas collagenimarina]